MRRIINYTFICIIATALWSCETSDKQSVEWVWKTHPEKVKKLLTAIDIDYLGMATVKQSLTNKDTIRACEALIEYYKKSPTRKWIRNSQSQQKVWTLLTRDTSERNTTKSYEISKDTILNDILNNVHYYRGYKAPVPSRADGGMNWLYTGPYGDKEYAFYLNRHYFLLNLLDAWEATNDPKYSKKYNDLIIDWVVSNAPIDTMTQVATWRELETGRRLPASWARTFYHFQDAKEFSPAARILMLSSIVDHTNYLTRFYKKHHNKATTALYGLASAACFWPEFKNTDFWLDKAMEGMEDEITHQLYPDGTQIELTNSYYFSVAKRFDAFVDMIKFCHKELPQGFEEKVEGMFDYLIYSSHPKGHSIVNNDSDFRNLEEPAAPYAKKHDRADWQYLITKGKKGTAPTKFPSTMYPWGGQLISRNSWEADAHWSYFDIGPWGRAHQHHDALNVVISAYGVDFLVDPGRYTYNNNLREGAESWRSHFVGSASHNVTLIDGKGQNPSPGLAKEAVSTSDYIITDGYDFARGSFEYGYSLPPNSPEVGTRGFDDEPEKVDEPVHHRSLLYLRDKYWLVVDKIVTTKPRKLEALWHFHPDCQVEKQGRSIVATHSGRANLQIIPIASFDWGAELVRGQTSPTIQGWYSLDMGQKQGSNDSRVLILNRQFFNLLLAARSLPSCSRDGGDFKLFNKERWRFPGGLA